VTTASLFIQSISLWSANLIPLLYRVTSVLIPFKGAMKLLVKFLSLGGFIITRARLSAVADVWVRVISVICNFVCNFELLRHFVCC